MDPETEQGHKGDSRKAYKKIIDSRYQIMEKELGSGSFATTYLTIDLKTKKTIACKMISKKELITKINNSANKTITKEYFINALKS